MNKLFQTALIILITGNISCSKSEAKIPVIPVVPEAETGFHMVKARANATSNTWNTYVAKTIDRLPGFSFTKDPEINSYGSWKVNQSATTGFFRVEKTGNRWWIIDPEGYPFIHKELRFFAPVLPTIKKPR